MTLKTNGALQALHAVVDEVDSYFIDRREMIEIVATALIARHHVILHGPPGCAKTDVVKSVTRRVHDAVFCRKSMHGEMSKGDLIGNVSINGLMQDDWVYLHSRGETLLNSHIFVADEFPRSSKTILDFLLEILEERKFSNGSAGVIQVPLLSAFATANSTLVGDHAANADRWLFRYFTKPLMTDAQIAALQQIKITRPVQTTAATITLDQLNWLHDRIPDVLQATKAEVWEALRKIMRDLEAEGIVISDRRKTNILTAVAAAAIYREDDQCRIDDLEVCMYVFPDSEDQVLKVQQAVARVAQPIKMECLRLFDIASEQYSKFEGLLAKAIDDAGKTALQVGALEINTKLGAVYADLDALQQTDATSKHIPMLQDRLNTIDKWQEDVNKRGTKLRLAHMRK